ncbi:MAG: [Clostridia bacterium]|nr:[FeFe] hydrogenase H-cluster maturation GTPase HydF [Clostridia bacterium]
MTRIGFFGIRNAGKSSLVNRITNQEMSVVSETKGTTTDPVKKTMEILPLGPVTIIDTPGLDDEGKLGEKRIGQTKKILRNCDIAVLVTIADQPLNHSEEEVITIFQERQIPYIIVRNKIDLAELKEDDNKEFVNNNNLIYTSTIKNIGIEELKNAIGNLAPKEEKEIHLVSDFIQEKDIVVLVTPIDGSAPKGRLILPQQLAIRDILDKHAIPIVTQPEELEQTLNVLKEKLKLVITDSQVFGKVKEIVPEEISLTSFSILMARYKGFLDTALEGVSKINQLNEGAKILIAEGCTHHKQCEDIGTVKIPKWLKEYTKKNLEFEWTNGMGFPEDLSNFDLIIHCGGCMLNENEMKFRMEEAMKQNVPFTNYGTVISYMQGILERATRIINKNE